MCLLLWHYYKNQRVELNAWLRFQHLSKILSEAKGTDGNRWEPRWVTAGQSVFLCGQRKRDIFCCFSIWLGMWRELYDERETSEKQEAVQSRWRSVCIGGGALRSVQGEGLYDKYLPLRCGYCGQGRVAGWVQSGYANTFHSRPFKEAIGVG